MSEAEQLTIDDYQLVNCIATGNASQVWEVLQVSTTQTFAMKLLLDEALEDVLERNTMKHEAKVGMSLEHPNIIQMFDSKVTKKQAYIIMEFFRSANLKTMILGSLTNIHVRMSKLAEAVTSAYAFMHEKGWINKDIKPDNILMTKGSEVRVIDFSLASKPDSALGRMVTLKSSIAIQGTRTYIAPELIKRERLTPSADIYSLGITFYECLTGRVPFTGTNPNELLMSHIQEKPPAPSEYHANISPQADALIAKMLAKKPADRHESMQEVLSELRNVNFFKMDPIEFDKQEQEAAAKEKALTVDQRLDSRSDHEHTQMHGHTPTTPKPKPPVIPEPTKPAAVPVGPAAQAPPPQMAPGMPPQMTPGMPPQMPPGMMPMQPGMYPQMPVPPGMMPQPPQMPMQPGMVPPGMPMPPQGMPQQPIPGQQPMPPQGQPGQPPPSDQPAPPQQPPVPAANVPAPQPPPAAPQPPPPAPAPEPPEAEPETPPDDLDWLNVV